MMRCINIPHTIFNCTTELQHGKHLWRGLLICCPFVVWSDWLWVTCIGSECFCSSKQTSIITCHVWGWSCCMFFNSLQATSNHRQTRTRTTVTDHGTTKVRTMGLLLPPPGLALTASDRWALFYPHSCCMVTAKISFGVGSESRRRGMNQHRQRIKNRSPLSLPSLHKWSNQKMTEDLVGMACRAVSVCCCFSIWNDGQCSS